MNRWTCVFLVLLRLSIGWHFLFEGISKIDSSTWTSEPYLLEATGPAAPAFRWMAGDAVAERYALVPIKEGEDPAKISAKDRFPPALSRDWNDYFRRFAAFYNLDDAQRNEAEVKLLHSKEQTALWMLDGTKDVKRESPWGPAVEIPLSVSARVAEYQKKLNEARRLQDGEWGIFGADVGSKVRTAKADASKMRSDLRKDLDAQTQDMKTALRKTLSIEQVRASLPSVLTPEQLAQDPVKLVVGSAKTVDDLSKGLAPYLAPEQIDADPVPPRGQLLYGQFRWVPPDLGMGRLDWIDWLTKYGLFAVGVGLLVGLFTRTWCVIGAGFLLLFFLAMPPLPGLPENPKAEGHYFYINKNIIEMLALLALATTLSGRWLGLDGMLQFFNPRRWRRKPATPNLKNPKARADRVSV